MRFEIVTIFPGFFSGFLDNGILRRAITEGLVEVAVHDLRAFTHDRHRTVDDRPFGGGEGMVLKPQPIAEALASLGIDPRPTSALSDEKQKRQRTTSQLDEKLIGSGKECQGTTSIVPQRAKNMSGFSPCGMHFAGYRMARRFTGHSLIRERGRAVRIHGQNLVRIGEFEELLQGRTRSHDAQAALHLLQLPVQQHQQTEPGAVGVFDPLGVQNQSPDASIDRVIELAFNFLKTHPERHAAAHFYKRGCGVYLLKLEVKRHTFTTPPRTQPPAYNMTERA